MDEQEGYCVHCHAFTRDAPADGGVWTAHQGATMVDRTPVHVCGWRGLPGFRWMHSGPLRFLCATCRGQYPTLVGRPDNIGPRCIVCYPQDPDAVGYGGNLYHRAMSDAGIDPTDLRNWPSR